MTGNPISKSQCKFHQALTVMQQLPALIQPTVEEKFKLYGLYKQSLYGSCPSVNHQLLTDSVQVAKWESWNDLKLLSVSEAQEEYFSIVLQFLKRYCDKPHISDIVNSLERGEKLTQIKLLQPISTEQKAICESQNTIAGLDFHKYDGRLSMLRSLTFPEHEESVYEDQLLRSNNSSSSEDFEDSSDDGSSLSTCTIKAYNIDSLQTNYNNTTGRTIVSSRLGLDPEVALEALQGQVEMLNFKLESLKKEIVPSKERRVQSEVLQVQTQQINKCGYGMYFFRKVILNILIATIVMVQIIRNRPRSNRILFIQLLFPMRTILKSLFATFKRLLN